MKRVLRDLFLFLLILGTAFSFVSCDRGDPAPKQQGILISDEPPYSAEALTYAEETFYSLLMHYTKKTTKVQTIPQATLTRLSTIAKNAASITAEHPIEEPIYLEVMESMRLRGTEVIDELYAFFREEGESLAKTRSLYLSLVGLVDPSALTDTFYELLIYSYDYRYEDAVAKYEKYGYLQHKELAENIRSERSVFTEQIGREGFGAVFSHALVFSELFSHGALSSEKMDSFTDEEILLFLQSLELSGTEIGDEGWMLILEKLPASKDPSRYGASLFAILRESGDYRKVATVMNDVTALTSAASDRLTADEIALLRAEEYEAAAAAVFGRFTDNDFETLLRIAAVPLEKEAYHNLAIEFYGEDYAEYAAETVPIGMEELRRSAATDTFYESLERYVAGISPAFSYGMKK